MTETIEVLVEGGRATAGPPIGPAIGPLGINVAEVVKEINEKTKDYEGLQIPVKVIVDKKKREFKVEVGTPTASALIKAELGIEKGSSNSREQYAGDIKFEKVVKIANMKMPSLLSNDLKSATKEIIGTCLSMGVKIDGKDAREILRMIEKGDYDDFFK